MTERTMHANLTSKLFPFNVKELSSTVVMNDGLEQNRQLLQGFDGTEVVQSFGICQAYFMRNAMPLTRGYSSVHYKKRVAAHPYSGSFLTDVYLLRDANNSVALFSYSAGKNVIYDAQVGAWVEHSIEGIISTTVTVSYVKGETYISFSGFGVYKYDFAIQQLVEVELVGLEAGAPLGIVSSNGYLLAYTEDTLYYSSPVTPTDFTPSIGGAGSTRVLDLRGPIVCCLPISSGFIIYTTTNAVSARYSGNALFPFVFDEVDGSAGVGDAEHVGYDSNAGTQVAWTTSGFQFLNIKEASTEWEELADSLARNLYTDANDQLGEFPQLIQLSQHKIKVTAIGDRYLIVSLKDKLQANPEFPMAYVFDIGLNRWGRIDIPHVDLFEFRAPEFVQDTTWDQLTDQGITWDNLDGTSWDQLTQKALRPTADFGDSFAVINAAGEVYSVILAQSFQMVDETPLEQSRAARPQIVLGRYKLRRVSGVMLQHVLVDSVFAGTEIRAYSHDYNGDYVQNKLLAVRHAGVASKWYGRIVGDAVSLSLHGRFNLTNLSLTFTDAGTRNLPVYQLEQQQFSPYLVVVDDVQVVVNGQWVAATP